MRGQAEKHKIILKINELAIYPVPELPPIPGRGYKDPAALKINGILHLNDIPLHAELQSN